MATYAVQRKITDTKDNVSIHQIATNAIKNLLLATVDRKSFIVNDIPRDLFLSTDEHLITVVLCDILLNTVSSGNNSCVRISAKKEYDEVNIVVKDNHSNYSRYISGKMTKVQPIVKKLGGQLRFEFNQRENITIILSFTSTTEG